MKSYFTISVVWMLVFTSCRNDDIDPREWYLGSYEIQEFEVDVALGSASESFLVNSLPEVDFDFRNDLPHDALIIDVREFINDIVRPFLAELQSSSTNISIDFYDSQIAEITGQEFRTNEIDFYVVYSDGETDETLSCEFFGNGRIKANQIFIDFEIILFTGSGDFVLSRSATGDRE